jgi:UDP-glucose 4-epimerase|tara:strand:+ start:2203 stop:3003 length:801 start_codon:yes stop_codon:yes gene_type:complete
VIYYDKKNLIDIASNKIFEFIAKIKPNCIVHLAAHPGGLSNRFPIENVKINALGSIYIFEWCKQNNCQLIFTSSSAVYGSTSSKSIDEKFALNPGTIYAANKIANENWIYILSNIKKFPWTILRLFPCYGYGHKQNTYQGIVNVLLTQILNSKKIIIKGSLKRERDLTYCKDVASSIIESIKSDKANGKIINIGTGISITVEEILNSIILVFGYEKNNYDFIEENGLLGDPLYSISNNSFAKEIINFRPRYDFMGGLEDMLKRSKI